MSLFVNGSDNPSNTHRQGEDRIDTNDEPEEEECEENLNAEGTTIPNLSCFQRISVGSGHILNDLCASLWFTYLLLYLEKVVGFSSDYAAALMLLGQVVDGIATPLIGYEADRDVNFWCFRRSYGRCKSWHLIGVVLVTLSFPFVFSKCIDCDGASDLAKVIYYAPFIAIFQIGWAATQISHLALIPKVHPDQHVRTELIAIRYGFTIVANVTVFLLTWFMMGFSQNCEITPNYADKFRNIAISAVGLGVLFSISFHLIVKEERDDVIKKRVNQQVEAQEGTIRNKRIIRSSSEEPLLSRDEIPSLEAETRRYGSSSFRENNFQGTQISGFSTKNLSLGRNHMSHKDWLMLPQFYFVALVYMATRLSVNLTQVYIPLYLQNSLRLTCGTVASIPLTMYISGFFASIVVKPLNIHLGRQGAYIVGASLSLAGSFCVTFLDWESSPYLKNYGIYGIAALLGSGASMLLVTSLSITADMIGNNVENGAFVYGSMSFTDKLSCGIGIMLINFFVPCQRDEESCAPLLIPYYKKILGYACGGSAILGVLGVVALTFIIIKQRKQR